MIGVVLYLTTVYDISVCRRSGSFSEGDFEKAEMHFPNVFMINGRPWCSVNHPPVTMQYLQHSTHSAEKDMIWNGEKATFKGREKLASLHCVTKSNSTVFQVMTWRRERQSLQQLRITPCDACNLSGHHCSGGCCAIPLSLFSAVENSYVKFARMTCKQDATCLADMKTCNGRECYAVEKALPGSYVWFGIPEMSGSRSTFLSEHDFLRFWTRESVYGVHSFVVDMHTLIAAYQQQIANGRPVVFRCGGTFLYTHEVCYVVIVTHEGDGVHDSLSPVTSLLAADDRLRQCNWSCLLDQNGHCTKKGYPQFFPYYVKTDTSSFWDHVVFAFHLPTATTLSVPQKDLIGGGPLYTNHTRCHKFRRATYQSGDVCAEEEAWHQSHPQSCDLADVSIDELFSSFEDAEDSAEVAPPSSSEAESHSRLTGVKEECIQTWDQEPAVDMTNISVEEFFSSFDESPETESQQHCSFEQCDHHPNEPPVADHSGSHSLTTADATQWVDPLGHSSPRLTRKRRHNVHYSVRDCTWDDVFSAHTSSQLPNETNK